MFWKNAQQQRIDELAAEKAQLAIDKRNLLQEVASTGVLLTSARDSRDIALRRCTHLEAENAQLERDIAGLLPDAEKYRRARANLIPGGPKAKAKREAAAAGVH